MTIVIFVVLLSQGLSDISISIFASHFSRKIIRHSSFAPLGGCNSVQTQFYWEIDYIAFEKPTGKAFPSCQIHKSYANFIKIFLYPEVGMMF